MRRLWVHVALLVSLSVAADAWARPPHKRSLKNYYGSLLADAQNACGVCHLTREQVANSDDFDDSAPPHNSFGARLAALGEQWKAEKKPFDMPARLAAVAREDADGDGAPNEVELLAGRFPGQAADVPSPDELTRAQAAGERLAAQHAEYPWRPFQPVQRPAAPQPQRREWVRNPIDAFLAFEHEKRGLAPRPEAPKHVLLRRVYLDLTGLPPTPDELHAFLNDASPDAYEKVVDRLLGSPRYGERWGRHWMDVWRYSDWAGWTDGKQIRDSQPHIWRWRDWIIESLNQDRGYDRMVIDMLAADEAHPNDAGALRATGYLARNFKLLSRETWMQEAVNHTAQAFLGLTVGCARCHDHMYDPIEQEEYYRLRAVFEPYNVRLDRVPGEPDTTKDGLARVFDGDPAAPTYFFLRGDDRFPEKDRPLAPGVLSLLGDIPFVPQEVSLPVEAHYPALAPFVQQETIAAAEKLLADARTAHAAAVARLPADAGQQALAAKKLVAAEANLAGVRARLAADSARYAQPPAANADESIAAAALADRKSMHAAADASVLEREQALAAARAAAKPDDAAAQKAVTEAEAKLAEAKQAFDKTTAALADATPAYTPAGPAYPAKSSGRRLAFARWVVHRQNPLAARVAVNHIWLRHFGRALVPSVFDFGQNGTPPLQPALLDWLAAEFMEPTGGGMPWSMKRLHRLILTSSAYRLASTPDEANLAADPDNRWLWRMPSRRLEAELVRDGLLYVTGALDPTMFGPDIDHKQGFAVLRRSVYFQHAQEKQMEFLKLFDSAAVTECYERKESIVPQQALALANSELTLTHGRALARRLHAAHADEASFVLAAFEQVLSRAPSSQEAATCRQFLAEQVALFAALREKLAAVAADAADVKRPAADPALRARENLVHVLLNHHDFVAIR